SSTTVSPTYSRRVRQARVPSSSVRSRPSATKAAWWRSSLTCPASSIRSESSERAGVLAGPFALSRESSRLIRACVLGFIVPVVLQGVGLLPDRDRTHDATDVREPGPVEGEGAVATGATLPRHGDRRHFYRHGLLPFVHEVQALLAVELGVVLLRQRVRLRYGLVNVVVAAARHVEGRDVHV